MVQLFLVTDDKYWIDFLQQGQKCWSSEFLLRMTLLPGFFACNFVQQCPSQSTNVYIYRFFVRQSSVHLVLSWVISCSETATDGKLISAGRLISVLETTVIGTVVDSVDWDMLRRMNLITISEKMKTMIDNKTSSNILVIEGDNLNVIIMINILLNKSKFNYIME